MNGLPEARTSIKTYALSLKRVKREKCNKIKTPHLLRNGKREV